MSTDLGNASASATAASTTTAPVVRVNIIQRIRDKVTNVAPADVPKALAGLIELLIEAEPSVLASLPVMFPGNAIVARVVSIIPIILPVLQSIETYLDTM